MTPEKPRQATRQRVLKEAKIIIKQKVVLDCAARDISPTGARLTIASPIGVPDTFDLAIRGEQVRHCRVVWRKPDQIGVVFVSGGAIGP